MSKCEICGKECNGKTCSGSCRAKLSRRTRTKAAHATSAQLKGEQTHRRNSIQPGKTEMAEGQLPANYGQSDCQCQMCQGNRSKVRPLTINHGDWKPASQLAKGEANRVPLPGDIDYHGAAEKLKTA
jgi:hypothetical protein